MATTPENARKRISYLDQYLDRSFRTIDRGDDVSQPPPDEQANAQIAAQVATAQAIEELTSAVHELRVLFRQRLN